jgi:sec-independent protein translocase protein TatB
MPSFSDSAVIFLIALLLFGPKKLPELARYVGKLMGEFRRASSEFRLQMEDEFRVMEQTEQQKKIAAIEAAAPVATFDIPEPEHPHMPAPLAEGENAVDIAPEAAAPEAQLSPVAIASNGDLHLMPPATGLPVGRSNGTSALSPMLNSIPHTPDPVTTSTEPEAPHHG